MKNNAMKLCTSKCMWKDYSIRCCIRNKKCEEDKRKMHSLHLNRMNRSLKAHVLNTTKHQTCCQVTGFH